VAWLHRGIDLRAGTTPLVRRCPAPSRSGPLTPPFAKPGRCRRDAPDSVKTPAWGRQEDNPGESRGTGYPLRIQASDAPRASSSTGSRTMKRSLRTNDATPYGIQIIGWGRGRQTNSMVPERPTRKLWTGLESHRCPTRIECFPEGTCKVRESPLPIAPTTVPSRTMSHRRKRSRRPRWRDTRRTPATVFDTLPADRPDRRRCGVGQRSSTPHRPRPSPADPGVRHDDGRRRHGSEVGEVAPERSSGSRLVAC